MYKKQIIKILLYQYHFGHYCQRVLVVQLAQQEPFSTKIVTLDPADSPFGIHSCSLELGDCFDCQEIELSRINLGQGKQHS